MHPHVGKHDDIDGGACPPVCFGHALRISNRRIDVNGSAGSRSLAPRNRSQGESERTIAFVATIPEEARAVLESDALGHTFVRYDERLLQSAVPAQRVGQGRRGLGEVVRFTEVTGKGASATLRCHARNAIAEDDQRRAERRQRAHFGSARPD
jgi:hypothetical protein